MYRVLSTQKCNIYCERDRCDLKCGSFHRPEVRKNANKSLRDRRAKNFRVQSLDISNHAIGNKRHDLTMSANSDGPPKVSYLNIQEPNAIEPITPLTVSGASTVTLNEIIASAKRKISQEYIDLRIPSPTYLNDNEAELLHHLARQRHLIGGTPWPKDVYHSDESDHKEDLSFVEHLVNSDSDDDEVWFDRDPPSIIEEGEQEDFDEILKVTQPPNDHYSNTLYKKADKLTKNARRKTSDLYDDNSSVDLSVADISESHLEWDLNFALLQNRLNGTDNKIQYEGNL